MLAGRARLFVSMGGNFLSAAPDTERTARALEGCVLTAHVATKLNRSHVHPGALGLILPCLGRTEIDEQLDGPQTVTVEDSMSMVHGSRGFLEPAGRALRSEPAIVAGLARAVFGSRSPVDWQGLVADYDRIRERIAACVPGFEDVNRAVREGRASGCPTRCASDPSRPRSGRAQFTVHELPHLALPAGLLRLMTIRSHDQYNTTIYGLDDRYRACAATGASCSSTRRTSRPMACRLTRSSISSASRSWGRERRMEAVRVRPYEVPRGCAAAYFPEANALVPLESRAHGSRTPASKSVIVRIVTRG
jgi:anaerobic selenocysteine-containing dehydrogenase